MKIRDIFKFNVTRTPSDSDKDSTDPSEGEQAPPNNPSDAIPPFQPILLQRTDVNNPKHRYAQTRGNAVAGKHTRGVADRLIGNLPVPFIYAKNTVKTIEEIAPVPEYDKMHQQWEEDNMFEIARHAGRDGMGVGTSFIVKTENDEFLVFNQAHITEGNHYWRDKTTRELVAVEFDWKASGGGKVWKGKIHDIGRDIEPTTVVGLLGINMIRWTPNPSSDDFFGQSDLTEIWNMSIYKLFNNHYNMVINKKGGIAARNAVVPDNVEGTWLKRLEREAQKGVEADLTILKYPRELVMSGVDPSKVARIDTATAGNTNYNEFDGMLDKMSPFPPSFVAGNSSNGLNTTAPEQNVDKENELLLLKFSPMRRLIKDINKVFYHDEMEGITVFPTLAEKPEEKQELDENGKPILSDESKGKDKTKVEDKSKQKNSATEVTKIPSNRQLFSCANTFRRVGSVKFSGKTVTRYIGNISQAGEYEFTRYNWVKDKEEKYYRNIQPSALKEVITNKRKLKTGYVSSEHTYSGHVSYRDAIGSYQITGYDNETQMLMAAIEIWSEIEDEELYTSPVMQQTTIGKNLTDLDIMNIGITNSPRSHLTGLESKIIKSV